MQRRTLIQNTLAAGTLLLGASFASMPVMAQGS